MTLHLDKAFYSPKEVAQLAGVHPTTILNYVREGKLYAVKLSERTYRIPLRSVLKLLDPESLAPPTVIERPDERVAAADADREPTPIRT
jgi:excisionase family DNA binding protein